MHLLKHRSLLPGLFLVAGLLTLFGPFAAGWLEIVVPPIARILLAPAGQVALGVALTLVALVYLAYLVRVARSRRTRREKALAFLPLLILPLILAAISPLGRSFRDRQRERAYLAGGRARMMLAGGPARVRAEALDLLSSPEQDAAHPSVPRRDVPPSLQRLGEWVSIQRDYGLVLVGIQPAAADVRELGYMIHQGRTPLSIPWFFEYASNLRVWKVAEGVYFFEE